LRSDPAWADALLGAGLDIDRCELVVHLRSAMVGTGYESGSPFHVQPALLLGSGETIAIAFPNEREVRVVGRPKARAQLQTQRSGTFQILFGSVNQLDVWVFNDFELGTPEGEQFGRTVLQFLRGQAGKPTAAAASPAPAQAAKPPVAVPAPPEPSSTVPPTATVSSSGNQADAVTHQLVHRLSAACSEVMRLHGDCSEKGELVQKAHYVAAQPQAPASREFFRQTAERLEQEFLALLNELRGAVATGKGLWSDFIFLSGGAGRNMAELLMPLATQGVIQSSELSTIMVGGIFLNADFGSTMESFYETDSRLAELMKSMDGQ